MSKGEYQNLISIERYEDESPNYSIVKLKDIIRYK